MSPFFSSLTFYSDMCLFGMDIGLACCSFDVLVVLKKILIKIFEFIIQTGSCVLAPCASCMSF